MTGMIDMFLPTVSMVIAEWSTPVAVILGFTLLFLGLKLGSMILAIFKWITILTLFLLPVWVACGIAWLLVGNAVLPDDAYWPVVVAGTILGYVWLYKLGKKQEKAEARKRAEACPVCNGWSGAVILTEAPVALMCDRHRSVAGRIAFLEGQTFGEESQWHSVAG